MKRLEAVAIAIGTLVVLGVWGWTSFVSHDAAPFGVKLLGTTSTAIVLALLLALAGFALLDWHDARLSSSTEAAPTRMAIPRDLQNRVWRRDEGRCQWKLETGQLCGSQDQLEFDHIKPVSRGGTNSFANLQLLCQRHNRKKAARYDEPPDDPIGPDIRATPPGEQLRPGTD